MSETERKRATADGAAAAEGAAEGAAKRVKSTEERSGAAEAPIAAAAAAAAAPASAAPAAAPPFTFNPQFTFGKAAASGAAPSVSGFPFAAPTFSFSWQTPNGGEAAAAAADGEARPAPAIPSFSNDFVVPQFKFELPPMAAKDAAAAGDDGAGDGAGTAAEDDEERERRLLFSEIEKAQSNISSDTTMKANTELKLDDSYSTGEEDDERLYQTRAKLFVKDASCAGGWREAGVGQFRINRMKDGRTRAVMRTESVFRLILNAPLVKGTVVKRAGEKSVIAPLAGDDGALHTFLVRMARKEDADALETQLKCYIAEAEGAAPAPAASEEACSAAAPVAASPARGAQDSAAPEPAAEKASE